MTEDFFYKNEHYTINFDNVCVSQSLNIDKNSFVKEDVSTFLEMQAVIEHINFKILKEDNVIFDSKIQNVNNLSFDLVKKIYLILKSHLYLSTDEINKFLESCELMMKEKKSTMPLPEELFIAQYLNSGAINLTLSELMSMETKKYEKIQLALNLLEQSKGDIGES